LPSQNARKHAARPTSRSMKASRMSARGAAAKAAAAWAARMQPIRRPRAGRPPGHGRVIQGDD
jgi:hypothetical protein